VDNGVIILDVAAGSPAANAGLKSGDVVVSLDGTEVVTVQDLTSVLHSAQIGQPLEIKYWRGSNEVVATVTPIAAPRS